MSNEAVMDAPRSRGAMLLVVVLTAIAPAHASTDCDGVRPGAGLTQSDMVAFPPRGPATFGFVFAGSDGRTYASTAGHAVMRGVSGEAAWPQGEGTTIFDLDGRRVGEFVYAIDTRLGARPPLPPSADLALIRLDDGVVADPRVCEIGGPHGVDARLIAAPEAVPLEWFGASFVGGRVGPPGPVPNTWLLPARSGYSLGMPSPYKVTVVGHASFGDSGAPVLSDGDLAVGTISFVPLPPEDAPTDGNAGVFTVARLGPALARAASVLGIDITLRAA